MGAEVANPEGSEPELLPGRSSAWLLNMGWALMIGFGLFTVPLGIASAFHANVGLAVIASIEFIGLTSGLALAVAGRRKKAREVANGYTCWIPVARENPSLYLVTRNSLTVVARPR